MGENAKNPSQLSDEDIHIVDEILMKCVVAMDRLLREFRYPEEYVKKSLLNIARTDEKFATCRILFNPSGTYNGPLPPHNINEILGEEARHFNPSEEDNNGLENFLHPRDMSEVMKMLEREGLYENVTGKKEIKRRFGLRRLKHWQNAKTGGVLSIYTIRKEFETVKKVMAEPEAQSLLREKLLKLPITLIFERFNLKAFFCLARANEEYLEKGLRLVARQEALPQLAQTQSDRHMLIQKINAASNKQIDALINQQAQFVAENRPYDLSFLYHLINFGQK